MTDRSTSEQWGTNTTLADIGAWLRERRAVVVLTHTKPDGDALGSSVALARTLNLLSETSGATSVAEVWLAGPVPAWAGSFTGNLKTRVLNPGEAPPGALDPDGVVVVDTGSWSQLDPFAEWLRPKRADTAVIDHHLSGDPDVGARRVIATDAAAACQPVAELCQILLGVGCATDLPIDIATALYLGLATDTGWFRHSNVSRDVMHLAGDLIGAGVDHPSMFEQIQLRERPARLRLLQRALASLELVEDKHLAILSLTTKDFAECGAAPGESGGFVDVPQSVASIRVTALMTEQESGSPDGPVTKLSLRSKARPWDGREPIDVDLVARSMGGGGHARAAGARVKGGLAAARSALLEAMG